MPAKLPNMFCHPVHLPAAPGPASVCVMAQMLEVNSPKERLAAIKSTMQTIGSRTMHRGKNQQVVISMPPAEKVLRTRVGLPPRAIHKSDAQPPAVEEIAMPQNGMEPRTAIIPAEKCRSRTRYDGSQVIRKVPGIVHAEQPKERAPGIAFAQDFQNSG